MSHTPPVRIGESSIHGRGIFATRLIKAGERILDWSNNTKINEADYNKLSSDKKQHTFCIGDTYIIMNSPERYMNHSCMPNTYVDDYCDRALRDIEPDEELTTNYFLFEKDALGYCSCNSQNCEKPLQIEVRKATINDLQAIQTLNKALFEKECREYDSMLDPAWPFSDE